MLMWNVFGRYFILYNIFFTFVVDALERLDKNYTTRCHLLFKQLV